MGMRMKHRCLWYGRMRHGNMRKYGMGELKLEKIDHRAIRMKAGIIWYGEWE